MMHVMPRRGRIRPAPSPAELRRVPIDQIDVPPRRLRRDLGDIDSLAASLGTFGQLAPVVCYTGADGRLRLIAGERRLEATRRLHAASGSAPEIDVLVRTLAPNQAPVELELIENAQRRELSDAEEADAFIQLTSQLGRRLQAVADISGRSVAYVSKRIRLFEDAELRAAIEAGEIATSQAEELLALPESVRGELLARSISQEWTHDRMRAEVRRVAQATDDTMSTRAGAPPRRRVTEPNFQRGEVTVPRPRDLTRRIRDLEFYGRLASGVPPNLFDRSGRQIAYLPGAT